MLNFKMAVKNWDEADKNEKQGNICKRINYKNLEKRKKPSNKNVENL